jgi:acyl-CoA reductase-like NAD-dependent aldehyde dehydrogenase
MAESTTQTEATTDEQAAPAEATSSNGAARMIAVDNPATGEKIGEVPKMTSAEIAQMFERARAAQPGWDALGFDGRARIFKRAQKWVLDNSDRIAATIMRETGKTHEDALLAEVGYAANAFGFWAKRAPKYLADEKIRPSSPFVFGKKLVVRYAPVGVVGVIGPWNYPLTNSFGDCIPALAAGNTVVLKPASMTPFTSLLLEDGMRECGFPEHVYQVATGDGRETGGDVIDHSDFVMFTGSTEVGKNVMERASKTLTPVGLELGGKDPMIVMADADLERAANAAVWGSMQNGGQTCISIERVYVEEPAYDEFVGKVTGKMRALRQGEPAGPGSVDIGAVTSPDQVDLIDGHVKQALASGARAAAGGKPGASPRGRYYEPTLLLDVDHSMECMTEETFGPTLPVMRVKDTEEAIKLANDSPFGLQASVWSGDLERGEQVAREIEAGAVCVNDAQINYFELAMPMGGWKTSGLGSRHGAGGIRKYTKQQSILVTRMGPKREVHQFPYRGATTRLIGGALKLIYGRGKRR